MTSRAARRALMQWLVFSLCLLPPAVLAVLLWRNSVNVPYWDEWDKDIAGLFVKSADGRLGFGDFWAQHNESRLVLPRLIFLLLGGMTHWNVSVEVAFTFLLAGVVAAAVFWLGRKAFAGRPVTRWTVFFISSLLIFSPSQYEAWLWGMEMILFMPLVCILGGLVVQQSALREQTKLVLCAILAFAGTFTFSNGLLVWLVLFPGLFLAEGWTGLRKRSQAALGWLLGFAGTATVYFYNYQFPPSAGIGHLLRTNPRSVFEYLLAFLGGSLVDRNAASAVVTAASIGLGLLVLFAASCVWVVRRWNDREWMRLAWPWLALGSYGILSAMLATIGRAGFGAEQATTSRYAIFGICLIVALVHLLPLSWLRQPVGDKTAGKGNAFGTGGLAALAGGLVLLYAQAFPPAVVNMMVFRLNLLQAKSCLKFIDVLPPQPAITKCLYRSQPELKFMADALNQRGVLDFKLYETPKLAAFKVNPEPADHPVGSMESCQVNHGDLLLAGWALSTTRRAAADCVVFTYESPRLQPRIFGLMDQRRVRLDLVAAKRNQAYLLAGWEKSVRLADLPRGSLVIKAWSYDVRNDRLTPLANAARVENK